MYNVGDTIQVKNKIDYLYLKEKAKAIIAPTFSTKGGIILAISYVPKELTIKDKGFSFVDESVTLAIYATKGSGRIPCYVVALLPFTWSNKKKLIVRVPISDY